MSVKTKQHHPAKKDSPATAKAKPGKPGDVQLARFNDVVEGVKLTKAFVLTAQQDYAGIVVQIQNVGKQWTKLATLCQKFAEKKRYLAIIDPATTKPYTRMDTMLMHLMGKAASTIFREMRFIRELTGVVPDEDIEQISKQNLEQVVVMKQAGVPITPEIISKAKELPEHRFQMDVAVPNLPPDRQPEVRYQIGAYLVTKSTHDLWERVMEMARHFAPDNDLRAEITLVEKQIAAICAECISAWEGEYEEAIAAMKEKNDATEEALDAQLRTSERPDDVHRAIEDEEIIEGEFEDLPPEPGEPTSIAEFEETRLTYDVSETQEPEEVAPGR